MRLAALALCLATVAAPASGVSVAPDRVLASVTGDFDEDGLPDRAVLVETDAGVDLMISAGVVAAPMRLAAIGAGMLWSGGAWGTLPALEIDEDGRLVATHQNEGIGRERWREVFTIGWHGGAFAVVRHAWESYDSLEPEADGLVCEADFLTGEASRNGAALRVSAVPVPVSEWTERSPPAFCTPG